jgi:formate hydrogenlyase transcriptional activator
MAPAEVLQSNEIHPSKNNDLGMKFGAKPNFVGIIGASESLRLAVSKAAQVAATDTTALITGETGTGKELLARAIHSLSPRRSSPLIIVNCAALSATLIESELFGHEKGSFTGANTSRTGRFELANKATIFLDEIGELPLELQAKLLRVLQEGEFERLGSSRTIKVDVRVIAATNQDLEEAVRTSKFRADLFYRLNVFPIRMPALRERREDIPLLTQFFVEQISQRLGKRIAVIPQEVIDLLKKRLWPGNIRELRNVIERALILTTGEHLRLPEWLDEDQAPEAITEPEKVAPTVGSARLAQLEAVAREHITKILEWTNWRIEGAHGAAIMLGVNPGTLRSRMKKLGIQRPRWRSL